MRLTKKRTMKRKLIKGGYNWRTPKKRYRAKGRGTRKTN